MARRERKKAHEKVPRTADEKKNFLHSLLVICGIGLLVIVLVVLIAGRFFSDIPILQKPRQVITSAFAPVQKVFSTATDTVARYFRSLKYRSNLEYEYEQLLIKVEELQNQVMLNAELEAENGIFADLQSEMAGNAAMNPIKATVIGHDSANYFSVLTVDKGTKDGIKESMAVVYGGGLVGYTYDVTATTAQVRTIIDSDCKIPALLESTRSQGTVKGAMGIDGNPLCRMYYLPENHLPRAGDVVLTSGVGMEFPKGIPIGTVRESTRGLEDNKQYVVVEPLADFQHLEWVTIFRYIPSYAETAALSEVEAEPTLVPLQSARPQATFAVGVGTTFEEGAENIELQDVPEASVLPSETPAPTPTVTPTPDPDQSPLPPNLEYNRVTNPTEAPSVTPSPRPTPAPTTPFDPSGLTVEEDD